MWSRNKANLYIRDALDDFHYDPKALPSPITQRKIYRNKLMLTHLIGFGGGGTLSSPGTSYLVSDSTSFAGKLTSPDHADWTPGGGSGNFTLETWVNFNALTGYPGFFSQYADGGNFWHLRQTAASQEVQWRHVDNDHNGFYFNYSWNPSLGTWYHVAVIRGWSGNADDYAITIDGSSIGTTTNAYTLVDFATPVRVGCGHGSSYIEAYIDEIRFSDTARWTSNFSPSTIPYTSDANTLLLIHCDEAITSGTTGSGATFTDSGNTGHTMTEYSGCIRDTSTAKF